MNAILRFLSGISLLNWLLIGCIVFLVIRDCSHSYSVKKASQVQAPTIGPKTDIIKEAEKIAEEVDTAGRAKVIYRLSEPIIQKIVDNEKLDSFANLAKARADKITSITQIEGQLRKENTDLKLRISQMADGKRDTSFEYSDKWLSLSGIKLTDSIFRIQNLIADASLSDIRYDYNKKWFFGKNENRATVYFESPYIRVRGMNTATIVQPESTLKFNLNVDSRYLHGPKEVLIGPSVRVGVGRLGVKAGYYLNPGGKLGNTLFYGADYSIY